METKHRHVALRWIALLALASLVAVTAAADGQHGTKIHVKNDSDVSPLRIDVYNGGDTGCGLPHKMVDIGRGDGKNVKCHGQNKDRCFIAVRRQEVGHPAKNWTTLITCKEVKDKQDCTIEGGGGDFKLKCEG